MGACTSSQSEPKPNQEEIRFKQLLQQAQEAVKRFHCTPGLEVTDSIQPKWWPARFAVAFDESPNYSLGEVYDISCMDSEDTFAKWNFHGERVRKAVLPQVHIAMKVDIQPNDKTLMSVCACISVASFVDEFAVPENALDASERWCPVSFSDRYIKSQHMGVSHGFKHQWSGNHNTNQMPTSYKFGFCIPSLSRESWKSASAVIEQFRQNLLLMTTLSSLMHQAHTLCGNGYTGKHSSIKGDIPGHAGRLLDADEMFATFEKLAFQPAKPDEENKIYNHVQSVELAPVPAVIL